MLLKAAGTTQIHTTDNLLALVLVRPTGLTEQKLALITSSTLEMGLTCHLLVPFPLPRGLGVIATNCR